jgi:hypothetical protein
MIWRDRDREQKDKQTNNLIAKDADRQREGGAQGRSSQSAVYGYTDTLP